MSRVSLSHHNIGLWYWEQEHFPMRWHSAFDYYDEIWVPSHFTQAAIAAVSPIPVRKITYPFYLTKPRQCLTADGLACLKTLVSFFLRLISSALFTEKIRRQ